MFISSSSFTNVYLFQIRSKIKKIKYDLPLQLGFFVYQYAKLKMLSFYYDVVDKFVDRRKFCLLEMDTGLMRYNV
jgi:hypothetical protein